MSDIKRQAEHFRQLILDGEIRVSDVRIEMPHRKGCMNHMLLSDEKCNDCRSRSQIPVDLRNHESAIQMLRKAQDERDGVEKKAAARAEQEHTQLLDEDTKKAEDPDWLDGLVQWAIGFLLIACVGLIAFAAFSSIMEASKFTILVTFIPLLLLTTAVELRGWVLHSRSVVIVLAIVAFCYQIGLVSSPGDNLFSGFWDMIKVLVIVGALGYLLLRRYPPTFGQAHGERGVLAKVLTKVTNRA